MSRFFRAGLVAPLFLLVSAAVSHADGDPVAGEKIFKRCAVCHGIGDTKKQPAPNLNNVIGRVAGTQPEYDRYSANMREAGQAGLVWTKEKIFEYIENPKKMIPKGTMSFPGLRKAEERADVVAYIAQFSKPEEPAAETGTEETAAPKADE